MLNRLPRSPVFWVAVLGIALTGAFTTVTVLTEPAEPRPPAHGQASPAAAPKPVSAAPAALAVAPQIFENLPKDQAVLLNAELPISALPNPPAAPFQLPAVAAFDRARALTCLTMAVYYEAASQGDDGEAAVAQVVLNRVRNPLFPKTVCGVVFQGSDLPTGCQFTFTCDGSLARRPSAEGWRRATEIAQRALGGYVQRDVGEATHYHTIWVVPYWRPTVLKVAQIGAHVFYRWNGDLGRPTAFTGAYAGFEPAPRMPAGFGAQDLAALEAPTPAPVSMAAIAPADGATDAEAVLDAPAPKPEVTIVEARRPRPRSRSAAPPAVVGPVSYFGGNGDKRPQRLPIAGR